MSPQLTSLSLKSQPDTHKVKMTNLTDLSIISSDTIGLRTPSPPPSWITIDEWIPTEGSVSSLEEGEIRSEWSEGSHPELQFSEDEGESSQGVTTVADNATLKEDSTSIKSADSKSTRSNTSIFSYDKEKEQPYFNDMVNWMMNSQQSGAKIKSVYTGTYMKEAHSPLVSYWEERVTGDEKVRAFLRISVPDEGRNGTKDENHNTTMMDSSSVDASAATIKAEVRGGSLTPPIRVNHSVKAEFMSLPSPVPATRRAVSSSSSWPSSSPQ